MADAILGRSHWSWSLLLCLGGMVYLLAKADEVSKRTKAFVKEKGLERERKKGTTMA